MIYKITDSAEVLSMGASRMNQYNIFLGCKVRKHLSQKYIKISCPATALRSRPPAKKRK